MPYEGEFAHYKPLNRIVESECVKGLLRSVRICDSSSKKVVTLLPKFISDKVINFPDFVIAIDGSQTEVPIENGYPGAMIGYLTTASVLLDLKRMNELDQHRPVDPVEFRKTEETSALDAAFPGSNVVVRSHTSAKDSFRESLYENFKNIIVDDDGVSLLDTYEKLLALKPVEHSQSCPYEADGCQERLNVLAGVTTCSFTKKPIYSTDALRVYERFRDIGLNGESLGEIMQVWERVLLVHLLRGFERRNLLHKINQIAFIIDGPLAVFGHPAWLSNAINKELKRINKIVKEKTDTDLIILGIEKSGEFVEHFNTVDKLETSGLNLFLPGTYSLLTDKYIKERIIFSKSDKRYGLDTYFGRKFFYKTKNGYRIVASIAFLSEDQDTLDSDDISLYPRFGTICNMLNMLVSSQYPNSLSPIIAAHAQAAIPLRLGGKVLEQLAKALMRKN
ncbi:MAG: DNA double-strand break repair nuclease NurA [Patescibacteria group bacterium]|jgi:hypothetical protein